MAESAEEVLSMLREMRAENLARHHEIQRRLNRWEARLEAIEKEQLLITEAFSNRFAGVSPERMQGLRRRAEAWVLPL